MVGWAIVFGTNFVITQATHTYRIHFAVHRTESSINKDNIFSNCF